MKEHRQSIEIGVAVADEQNGINLGSEFYVDGEREENRQQQLNGVLQGKEATKRQLIVVYSKGR